MIALEKEEQLKSLIRGYGTLAVGYSGGVDSAYLADVAHEVLDANAHMVIADSPSIPRDELEEARAIAQERGWNLAIIATGEFEKEEFLRNDSMRCYVCKSDFFEHLQAYAQQHGIAVLAYGENADDGKDLTRHGAKAAREQQVKAPLVDAGMSKDDIRERSQARGLPTWNKPSFACLSSRFPSGTRVSPNEILKVERAEQLLRKLGFRQYRARHHGELCRIEVETQDFERILQPETRQVLIDGLRKVGYRHVTLDLAGYRTGSTAGMAAKEVSAG